MKHLVNKFNLALCLVLVLVVASVPTMPVFAAGGAVTEYDISTGDVNITTDGDYKITGTTTTKKIKVSSGVTANITLDNVSIVNLYYTAFDTDGATVNLTLSGTNILESGYAEAGLYVPTGATLTIDGTGSLTAIGGERGAGIGGCDYGSCGKITINGGTVKAQGGHDGGAGIGGGDSGSCGEITINGGTVTAHAGGSDGGGAGIGGGREGSGGTIKITGTDTVVNAKGHSNAHDIGAGYNSLSGTNSTTITGGSVFAANNKISGFASSLYGVKATVYNSSNNKADGATVTVGNYSAKSGGNLTNTFTDGTYDEGVAYLWVPASATQISATGTNVNHSDIWLKVDSTSASAVTAKSLPSEPDAPTSVSAVAGNAQATVSFIVPNNGGSAITGYTVTASPGGKTATGTTSPITITGLTNNAAYTFTVKATNAVGTGVESATSNSVTPTTSTAALTGTVSISGTGTYGQTLTADISGITSNNLGTISYQWKRGGTAITGATSSTYKLVAEDVGEVITVDVSAANYPGSLTSKGKTIEKAVLTITGFDISKSSDGNNKVTGFGTLSFNGLQNGETASVDASAVTAVYDNANSGTGKAITFSGSFGMTGGTANASNYTIIQPTGLTGTITAVSETSDDSVTPDTPATPDASKTAPKTGNEDMSMICWMLLALAAVGSIVVIRKKKQLI